MNFPIVGQEHNNGKFWIIIQKMEILEAQAVVESIGS